MNFSVIILCYNSKWDALKRTIDSVLKQKNITFEVILADDASENDCIQKAKDYLESSGFHDYKVKGHDTNVGTVKNISDALSEASGRYVKCIGAGDMLYEETTLQKAGSFLSKTGCAMCFGKMQAYRLSGENMILSPYPVPADILSFRKGRLSQIKKNIIRYHGWIAGASMFYRTDKFRLYLPEILGTVRYCEDLLQVNLLLHKEKIAYCPHAMIYYEVGSGISTNAGSGNHSRIKKDHDRYWDMMCERYKGDPLVKQGRKTHLLQYISGTPKRLFLTLLQNPGYLILQLKTKLQKRYYAIDEKAGF